VEIGDEKSGKTRRLMAENFQSCINQRLKADRRKEKEKSDRVKWMLKSHYSTREPLPSPGSVTNVRKGHAE
jgi:hypothetical protein